MSASEAKRQRQRKAREARKQAREAQALREVPPRLFLEKLPTTLELPPFDWSPVEGVSFTVCPYLGEVPDGLAELAREAPDDLAVIQRPATFVAVRNGSPIAAQLAQSVVGGA
jgi:hypothetical protein